MRYILILILLINTAYGQGVNSYGAARSSDTSKTFGQVRMTAYGIVGDTAIPVILPNGVQKQVSISRFSSGGSSFDSTKYVKYADTSRNGIVVTYWVLDSTNKKNIKYADTVTKVATKWDVDSLKNGIKYQQLNNLITAAPTLDYIIMDGDTCTWDKSFREIGNCIWYPKINKWVFVYVAYTPPYDGTNVYMGVLLSSDLRTWTKVGQISSRAAEDPYVLVSGDSLYLYAEDKADVPFRNIRMWTSGDAVTWTDKGDVLDIGTSGSWDEGDVSSPVVKQIGDTIYMWYEGRGTGNGGAIGIAKSTDKYNWTKYGGNPVITGNQQANPIFSWGTHVVSHDIQVVDDEIYLFCTPYVAAIPSFVSGIALGSTRNIYKYRDYLGTWLAPRRDMNIGGQKIWTNNRLLQVSYDKTQTKLTMTKFTNIPVSDFVNKPIVTDDSIRGKYIRVKNPSGYTSTIYNAGTADRADTMPDKSGTIAMTSDIQTYTNGYGINKTGNTFSADTSSANGLVTQSDLSQSNQNLQQVTALGATTTDGIAVGNITSDTVNGGTASGGDLQLLSTTNATKGKLRFGANSFYDEVNNGLFIGSTTAPTGANFLATQKLFLMNSGANTLFPIHSSGGTPIIQTRQSNGTLSSPTATTNGQILSQFLFDGYDGVSAYKRGGELRFSASENWSNTAVGTIFSIQTAINGTTTRTERIGSNSSGDVIFNSGGGNTFAQNRLIAGSGTYTGNGRAIQATGRIGASDTIYTATRMQEAGVTNGIIKADANGVHLIATAGTDYLNSTYIEDAINNGTTDKAPSENAVYDALVLKKDIATDTVVWAVAVSDLTTALTTGTNKAYFRMPYAATLVKVKASVLTVSSSGTPTFDINEEGTSVLGTKLSIDASEKTSETAASAATITDSALARDSEIEIDIDTAGTSTAGAVVYLYWIKA